MKICDKCLAVEDAQHEVHVISEELYFDLCQVHLDELLEFLQTKTKRKRKLISIGKYKI